MKKLNLIIDTREKSPFTFSSYEHVHTYTDTLDAGDYTICGHDNPNDDHSVIIERKKDSQELVRNLCANWDVFEREMEILTKYKNKMIIVCGPNNFNHLYDMGFTKVHPNYFNRQLAILQADYQIPVCFFPDKLKAEDFVFRLFYRLFKKIEEEN